jgi:hypothetical protein
MAARIGSSIDNKNSSMKMPRFDGAFFMFHLSSNSSILTNCYTVAEPQAARFTGSFSCFHSRKNKLAARIVKNCRKFEQVLAFVMAITFVLKVCLSLFGPLGSKDIPEADNRDNNSIDRSNWSNKWQRPITTRFSNCTSHTSTVRRIRAAWLTGKA